MSFKNNLSIEIIKEVTKIAHSYKVFQCVECSSAIKKYLIRMNIAGKQIKLDLERQDLPWSVIYDLRRSQQISTNGYHEGICLIIEGQEVIFDNIDHDGVLKENWLQNLTSPTMELGLGKFKIREENF